MTVDPTDQGPRLKFDGTINLGTVATLVGAAVAVIVGYTKLESNAAQFTETQRTQAEWMRKLSDSDQQQSIAIAKLTVLVDKHDQDIRDLKEDSRNSRSK